MGLFGLGDKAWIGIGLGVAAGAAAGFVTMNPAIGVAVGVAAAGQGGVQGYQADTVETQIEKQNADTALATEKNERIADRQAARAMEQAARGLSAKAAEQFLAEREMGDPAAFKKRHTPHTTGSTPSTQSDHGHRAEVRAAFLGLRNDRPKGNPVQQG